MAFDKNRKENKSAVLEAEHLCFSYDGAEEVIRDLSIRVRPGRITSLLGANGCGKSTLFGLLTNKLEPDEGVVRLGGEDIGELSRKEFARSVAIVQQHNIAPPDLTVERLVGYGRTPYLSAFQSAGGRGDREAIDWAMEVTKTKELRGRAVSSLSGGQRQRVWIAMALAQETDILFLDEPTTYLDIRYQIEVLRLIRELNRVYGLTIVMVLHDINQAMAYSDHIVGMKDGRLIAEGDPAKIVDQDLIEALYGIRLPVIEADGRKVVLGY